jgi:hypothetical protein
MRSSGAIPDGLIESALDATSLPWVRREAVWTIPLTASLARELLLRRVPHGVRVEGVLAEWDEAGARELEALRLFLRRAEPSLHFAHCAVDGKRAVVFVETSASDLETSLPQCIGGVAAACRLLAREAAALLAPELAAAYLDVGCSNGLPDEASRGTVSRPAVAAATVV